MVGFRSQQSSSNRHALRGCGPSEDDQVRLGLLFDYFVDEGGREDHLGVAMGEEGVGVAGAINKDVKLGEALRWQHYRWTLFPHFGVEFGD